MRLVRFFVRTVPQAGIAYWKQFRDRPFAEGLTVLGVALTLGAAISNSKNTWGVVAVSLLVVLMLLVAVEKGSTDSWHRLARRSRRGSTWLLIEYLRGQGALDIVSRRSRYTIYRRGKTTSEHSVTLRCTDDSGPLYFFYIVSGGEDLLAASERRRIGIRAYQVLEDDEESTDLVTLVRWHPDVRDGGDVSLADLAVFLPDPPLVPSDGTITINVDISDWPRKNYKFTEGFANKWRWSAPDFPVPKWEFEIVLKHQLKVASKVKHDSSGPVTLQRQAAAKNGDWVIKGNVSLQVGDEAWLSLQLPGRKKVER